MELEVNICERLGRLLVEKSKENNCSIDTYVNNILLGHLDYDNNLEQQILEYEKSVVDGTAVYYKSTDSRILFIDKEIAEGNFPNASKLSKKYKVSVRTIKRDLAYMRNVLRVPIEYDSSKKGHYYTDNTFRLPAINANLDSVFSMAIAHKLLKPYQDVVPIYSRIKTTLDNLDSNLLVFDDNDSLWLNDKIAFLYNDSIAKINTETWLTITSAMVKSKCISFYYNNGYDKNYNKNSVRIEPYQIVCKLGIWYLVGYSKADDSIKKYSLGRIEEVKMLDDDFKIPTDYKYIKSIVEPKDFKCKVIFFNESILNAKTDLQKVGEIISIDEIDENTSEFLFTTSNLEQVSSMLLKQSSFNNIVLEPIELVDMYNILLHK